MRIAIVQNVTINDHRMVHSNGLARELVNLGNDVDVIIQMSSEKPQFKDTPYEVVSLPGKTYGVWGQFVFSRRLFKFLHSADYDVIHAKNPFSSILPALLARICGSDARLVYDMRGLWVDFGVHSGSIPWYLGGLLNWLDVKCLNGCDAVIAISEEMKRVLVERGVSADKVKVVVGDGVELRDVDAVKGEDGLVGYVGSISRSRSSEKILEAFSVLRKRVPGVKLMMVGPVDPGDEDYFREYVEELGLSDAVTFTGFVGHDEALGLMKRFWVSLAYHEGDYDFYNVAVPTKILEYMAAGCCIVATSHDMYDNVLRDGFDALLTEQDPESFANGIERALLDNELNRQLRFNALSEVNRFSRETLSKQVFSIYQRIVSG